MYTTLFIVLVIGHNAISWRAVPTNQASFSQRRQLSLPKNENIQADELLPRTALHSVYKFGWCRPDVLAKVNLKRTAQIHFATYQSAQADYVYLLELRDTQRFRLQCVVMKIMVPNKYLFRRSRLPLYYCQGTLFYVMFMFIQRMEVHELFLYSKLAMPADMLFEFYHPPTSDNMAKEIFHEPLYF